ncbi:FAD-dependent monooxygenase [uncultured Nevskia sp.]|uniref:FAD-dependent monooxygenase n=1 Tax=uncultured Nevskia sp. TaxID=228950 RepID=UPI0025CDC275|nr:FAD-dependent monooxygenase [uncultured Nevskia sp.]
MTTINVDVLVVGAGGCGLNLSIFLADLGVDFLCVERSTRLANLPKAHYLNQRTMEILRQHGVADDIYAMGTPPENMSRAMWLTTLGGDGPHDRKVIHEMDGIGGSGDSQRAIYERDSACRSANLPLIRSEPIFRRHADARAPGRLRFGTELLGFTQDADGVSATIRDVTSGEESTVRAQYLIGADGGRTIGKALGNRMIGPSGLAKNVTVHFTADLSKVLLDDRVMLHFFIHPTRRGPLASGALVPAGGDDAKWGRHSKEWIFHFMVAPDDPAKFDEAVVSQQIRELLKLPDLQMQVHKISHWMIEAVLAERYQFGRVILAGDAAHRHPPASGLGLNTGIQDAHNLAWKLALVTRGQAGAALLDSYEAERRPIGSFNVAWALSSYWNHLLSAASIFAIHPANVYEAVGQPDEDNEISGLFADTPDGRMRRARLAEVFNTHRVEMYDHDVELGYVYEQGARVPDGTPAPARDPWGTVYVPTTRPGHRLPHAWLERDGLRISTHDLLDDKASFVLIANAKGKPWCEAARQLADELKPPLRVVRIAPDGDALDADRAWQALSEVEETGALLVRPDAIVAWRARQGVADPHHELKQALQQILQPAH